METIKVIGRSSDCDIVVLDPKRRVSRKHAVIRHQNGTIFLKDLDSLNGTYVNGTKITSADFVRINPTDKVTLSIDYLVDKELLFPSLDNDRTMVLNSNAGESTVIFDQNKATFSNGKNTVQFDMEKTSLNELIEMDTSPFVTVGRSADNKCIVNDDNVSRNHCRIRMLTPQIIEIEDLMSSNGTFADKKRLEPNKKYQFGSSVEIVLGKSNLLDLQRIFPQIQIIQKRTAPLNLANNGPKEITHEEFEDFNELKDIWEEYQNRQSKANNVSMRFSIGGAALGIAAVALTGLSGGIGGLLFASGGGIIGRYLGQQKSNEIKSDLTYEEAFLQTYCCPRCKESFQKKPWVTIRDCFKCKIKFR
jgi:pSer/pThr/pTyr-binding forkhead associated (FHA) protein